MPHSYVWHCHDTYVAWLIHIHTSKPYMWDMTHPYPYQQTEPWMTSPDASRAESRHICMSHGTYEWVTAYTIESYKCVMPHMNVTHQQTEPSTISLEASRVASWHDAHPSQSHARQPIMRAPFTTDPSHQLHLCVCVCVCVTCLIDMQHDSLIVKCDVTHSYVWHDSLICATWLIHMCDTTHFYLCHGSFLCLTWHRNMCDMTHSYGWHDSFICVTWLIHVCAMTQEYAAGLKKK